MAPLIGYYAHHHGSGHRTRARLIADAYPGAVDIIGSGHDEGLDVRLPFDVDGSVPQDPTAGGTLHWAPRYNPLLADRVSAMAEWVRSASPALVVVDVSVEVALEVRMMGIPVVVVRQHGDRTDVAHDVAYRIASSLLAPYPEWAEDPTATPAMRDKTQYVGGFSRFGGRPPASCRRDPDEVVVMAGTGGTDLRPDVIASLASVGRRRWTVIGVDGCGRPGLEFLGRVDDPWPWLCRAGVVVVSAGHSALCEAADADAPTVAVVETRPFAEQHHKVSVLAAAGAVHRAPPLGDPVAWDVVLRQASATPSQWRDFTHPDGATHAATRLAALAESLTEVGS